MTNATRFTLPFFLLNQLNAFPPLNYAFFSFTLAKIIIATNILFCHTSSTALVTHQLSQDGKREGIHTGAIYDASYRSSRIYDVKNISTRKWRRFVKNDIFLISTMLPFTLFFFFYHHGWHPFHHFLTFTSIFVRAIALHVRVKQKKNPQKYLNIDSRKAIESYSRSLMVD